MAEQAQDIEKLKKEKEEHERKKKEEEQKAIEEAAKNKVDDSMWGQLDAYRQYSKDMVTKAQGYEDKEPVEPAPPPKPKKILSFEEQEKENTEKMIRFSEYVAADAEAS